MSKKSQKASFLDRFMLSVFYITAAGVIVVSLVLSVILIKIL